MGGKWVNSVRTAEYTRLRELLRETRQKSGVTQRALSAQLNESDTYVDKIERGVRRVDVVEFINYAQGLGLDPVQLFTEFLQSAYSDSQLTKPENSE